MHLSDLVTVWRRYICTETEQGDLSQFKRQMAGFCLCCRRWSHLEVSALTQISMTLLYGGRGGNQPTSAPMAEALRSNAVITYAHGPGHPSIFMPIAQHRAQFAQATMGSLTRLTQLVV